MSMRHSVVTALVLPFLSGCNSHMSPKPNLDSWSKFESDVVAWFNENYGRDNNMRFAPSGIAYPIGSVLRKGSYSVLSSTCQYSSAAPEPLDGPTMPDIKRKREIDAKVDASSYAAKLLGEGSKLQAGLKIGPSLSVKISEPMVHILAEDQTVSVLRNSDCLSAVVGQNVSIIRGYVTAKYAVSSVSGGSLDGSVTVKNNELAKLTVADNGEFTIEDAKATKKLAILSDATVVKEVIVSGGSPLLSAEKESELCSEVPRVLIKSTDTSVPARATIPARIGSQVFSSCSAVEQYARLCNSSIEEQQKCRRDLFSAR